MKLRDWYRANAESDGDKARISMQAATNIPEARSWTWLDVNAYDAARTAGHFGRLALGEASERATS